MLEAVIDMSNRNLDYARRLIGGLTDEQAAAQPAGARAPMNHALWVVGHLALVSDVMAGILEGQAASPALPAELFGGLSKPQGLSAYQGLTLASMMERWTASRAQVHRLARAKPADYWSQPVADEKRRARWGSNDKLLVHMTVNHDAIHLGQLSAWRRAQGLPAV